MNPRQTQRHGNAEFFSNTKSTKKTEVSFILRFPCSEKIINARLMWYYTFSLREDINYHECHINIALIFIFPCSQKIENLRYNQAKNRDFETFRGENGQNLVNRS